MGKLKNFPEPGNLSRAEVGAIISLLVEHEGTVLTVREEFKRVYKKDISMETVQQIRSKYEGVIAQKMAEYIKTPGKIKIARRAWRLMALQRIYRQAMEGDARIISQKYDHNTYDHVERPDWKIALAAIMAAEKIQSDAEKTELDVQKLKLMELQLQIRGGQEDTDEEDEEGDVDSGSFATA